MKPRTSFYKGTQSRCRDCTNRIYGAVYYAQKSGRLVRPGTCSQCGSACKPVGHHPDHDKPLEVVWLCQRCHTALHAALRKGALA
jgi:hypothetical protein